MRQCSDLAEAGTVAGFLGREPQGVYPASRMVVALQLGLKSWQAEVPVLRLVLQVLSSSHARATVGSLGGDSAWAPS